jgi:hypothetical protein
MSPDCAVVGVPPTLPLTTSARTSAEDFRRASTADPAPASEPAGQGRDSALPSSSTSMKRREVREVATVVGEKEARGRWAVRGLTWA